MPVRRPTNWRRRRRTWSTRFPPSAMRSRILSKYLIGEGKKQGAILFENDAAGIAGRDDFVKYFPEAGGTILSQEPDPVRQTDFRPALLKLADAKPDVMLVVLPAGCDWRSNTASLGCISPLRERPSSPIRSPSPIAGRRVSSIPRCGSMRLPNWRPSSRRSTARRWSIFVRQYYNATQILLTVADKLLSEGKPLTGENMHDTLFAIRKFQGLCPAGVQEQHRDRPAGHRRGERRQGRCGQASEQRVMARA